MKGDLTANIEKNGKKFVRKLNPDRTYVSKDGNKIYDTRLKKCFECRIQTILSKNE